MAKYRLYIHVMKITIIDPPSGWKYGFPKPIPEDRKKDSMVWLVEQGYPQSEIDALEIGRAHV